MFDEPKPVRQFVHQWDLKRPGCLMGIEEACLKTWALKNQAPYF